GRLPPRPYGARATGHRGRGAARALLAAPRPPRAHHPPRRRGAAARGGAGVCLILRAVLLELPAGGLPPVLRDPASVLSERLEAREKARSRASTLQLEAAILALSPIVLLLLVGLASPAYLDAYRTPAGTLVGAIGGLLIFGCFLLVREVGWGSRPGRWGG